uniref:Innexin n=1 Tax=Schistocephalus solidus TaxID=70667 RepID=A0A0X3P476_SCHSO
MLGKDFIDSYQKYQAIALVGVQDWADRLSFAHSTVILIICTAIVSAKTYILKPLACHVPTVPTGSNFKDYMASYCWVHGTVPIGINETIPEDETSWDALSAERKMAYYQWVPFVLGLQTILFYVPHVIWQNVTFNRLGTDLTAIISKAMDALKTTAPEKREQKIANVAERLELLLFAHRDYRRGKMAAVGRQVSDTCGLLLASKRLGTWTVFSYLCIKLLYLANAIGQLYLMKEFLGYSESMTGFMIQLTQSLIQGSDWRESLYFPRVAFCSVKLRHLGQSDNRFLGMCALAVNMLNEKIYIFLWYWTMLVAICTGVSIITWFLRLTIRRRKTRIIRKYLKLGPEPEPSESEKELDADTLDPDDPRTVDRFIKEFLRLDGVFIVHMLNLNAGDIVTGEVIRLLWKAWLTKYAGRRDFSYDPWWQYSYPPTEDSQEKLELTEKPEA